MKLAIRKRTEDFASLMTIALSASRSLQNGSIYLLSNNLGKKEENKKKKTNLCMSQVFCRVTASVKSKPQIKTSWLNSMGIAWKLAKKANGIQKHRYTL